MGLRTRLALAVLLGLAAGARAQTVDDVRVSGPQPYSSEQPLTTGSTIYSVSFDDASASLQLFADARLVLSVDTPARPVAPAMLARALAPLFGAVIRDHPEITTYGVMLRDRDAILDRVRRVLATSAGWDGRRGRPVHGNLPRYLVATVNSQPVLLREIRAVFKSYHYKFELNGVGLISIAPTPALGGKRLPSDIARMDFIAVKF